MRLHLGRAFVLASICGLAACTSAGATKRGVVRFNEVFAEARNEILLLNILRARTNEPQQFSTVSTVTGSMRPQIGLAGELDNLVLGAADIFKPSGSVALRNPDVTIAPLETKEFRQGMMKAVEPAFVQELIEAGWEVDVVLHLLVAGVRCGGSTGEHRPPFLGAPAANASAAVGIQPQWRLDSGKPVNEGESVRLAAADAAKILREGMGAGLKAEVAARQPGDPPETVRLQFKKDASARIVLGSHARICGEAISSIAAEDVMLRSPAAMIQYLGLVTRGEGGGNTYFQIFSALGRTPDWALVGTRFRDNTYVVPRSGKSAQTLALLAEVIGFQTTDASINASKPTLTVSSD